MSFIEWLLKGFSDIIHDWAVITTVGIVGGMGLLCLAMWFVLTGQWLLFFLQAVTMLYVPYYLEDKLEDWCQSSEL